MNVFTNSRYYLCERVYFKLSVSSSFMHSSYSAIIIKAGSPVFSNRTCIFGLNDYYCFLVYYCSKSFAEYGIFLAFIWFMIECFLNYLISVSCRFAFMINTDNP